ncbi:hypothetical protein GGR50DRAFT_687531 [Xylaria sp. CBS 124048]|nr:hypothetical protein GGR50DRAFT_687531 [Xylaria sp. CBS 124048]
MSSQSMKTAVELTPKETQLKDLLLDTAKYINSSQPDAETVVLRWAGGWVRDKLLGVESDDIDTAINTMTGEAFVWKIFELCEQPGTVEKHRLTEDDIGNLHKIPKNPEKSKHLETTTVRLFGFDVDFVNLRQETYTETSRNPQVEFGGPKEDALRRDATVNALFLNLNTGEVEDFTGGLADMKSKLIRTPVEPFQTFMDDPLRILRLIRFASRLGFTIDPAAEHAMGDAKVIHALKLKISRERIGTELEKMLKGKDPRASLQYVDKLGLYHGIFTDPSRSDLPLPDLSQWSRAYECLEHLCKNLTPGSIGEIVIQLDEEMYFAWLLCALTPWGNVDKPVRTGKGTPPPPFITLVAREGIRARNKICDLITAAYNNRADIMDIKAAVLRKDPEISDRARLGMAIRHWDAKGGHWKLQVLFSLLVEAMQRWEVGTTGSSQYSSRALPCDPSPDLLAARNADFLGEWQSLFDHIRELDVMDATSLNRIIDGKQLADALGVRPGRWMTEALEVCVAWQFRNPNVTDPAGAIEEVRSKRKKLAIPSK